MDAMDFIYVCTNPDCFANGIAEAPPEPMGSEISVCCGRCGRKRTYPTIWLNNETPSLLEEYLRGYFEVRQRYVAD